MSKVIKLLEDIRDKCCSHCESECDGCWLEEEISDIQLQLAEKEKEIEKILKENERLCVKYNVYTYGDKIEQDKIYAVSGEALEFLINNQNQKAIEQLEKIKELCKNKFEWWENSEWEGNIYDKSDVSNAYFDIEANIDEQIKQLKEMK